jgi:hypothetical protein
MTAPFEFTDAEQEAITKIDRMAKALSKVEADILQVSRRIVREKARRDQLVARKQSLESKMREALDLIDSAKQRTP